MIGTWTRYRWLIWGEIPGSRNEGEKRTRKGNIELHSQRGFDPAKPSEKKTSTALKHPLQGTGGRSISPTASRHRWLRIVPRDRNPCHPQSILLWANSQENKPGYQQVSLNSQSVDIVAEIRGRLRGRVQRRYKETLPQHSAQSHHRSPCHILSSSHNKLVSGSPRVEFSLLPAPHQK